MNKRYLEPGESIGLNFYGYVGETGTIEDVKADADLMIKNCGNDPLCKPGGSIGTVERDGYTADVFMDEATGKLWYNDDDGWY
jgi:hypothetical protein